MGKNLKKGEKIKLIKNVKKSQNCGGTKKVEYPIKGEQILQIKNPNKIKNVKKIQIWGGGGNHEKI